MALPLSGNITSTMILAELGFTSPSDVLRNVIQKPNGRLQVMVNNVWVNLNMCSPYLPSEVSPYIVASDWYGYNHTAAGVTAVSITGNTTVSVGQTITYTATLQGTNLSNAVITWYKFENGNWSAPLAFGTSVSITWNTPKNAKIKAVVSNNCSGVTVETEKDIVWYCEPPTTVSIQGMPTLETGQYSTYYKIAENGTNTAREYFWIITGPVTIISGQNTGGLTINCYAAGLVTLQLRVRNHCGEAFSNVQSITATTPAVSYDSTERSADIPKQGCPSGTTPEVVHVEAYAGQFKSTESVAKANEIRDAWMAQQAQDLGQCFYNTPIYNSDYWHGFKQRNNCPPGYTGGWANLTATAGQFTSTVNVADANAQRDAWLQNQANNSGVGCFDYGPTQCGFTINSLDITVADATYQGNAGTSHNIPWAAVINVSAAGAYTIKGYYGDESACFWQNTVNLAQGQQTVIGGALSLATLHQFMPNGGQFSGPLIVRVTSSCHSLERTKGNIVYSYAP